MQVCTYVKLILGSGPTFPERLWRAMTLKRRKKNVSSSICWSSKRNRRIDILSPTSKKIHLQNICAERKCCTKIARKYWEKTKIELNEKESREISFLVKKIQATGEGREELEKCKKQCKSGSGKN